jgi:hypothetical protein
VLVEEKECVDVAKVLELLLYPVADDILLQLLKELGNDDQLDVSHSRLK